jgi:hypothetical protein
MHLKIRQISFMGILAAFSVVLVVLGGVIESSTLFFLAAASFCVGIVIREYKMASGVIFLLVCIFLDFLIAPNKFYINTYTGLSVYILGSEILFDSMLRIKKPALRKPIYWIGKYLLFNLMYIPGIIFFPKLIYSGEINTFFLALLIVGGQAVLFVYDRAYNYFQKYVWGKFRKNLKGLK